MRAALRASFSAADEVVEDDADDDAAVELADVVALLRDAFTLLSAPSNRWSAGEPTVPLTEVIETSTT